MVANEEEAVPAGAASLFYIFCLPSFLPPAAVIEPAVKPMISHEDGAIMLVINPVPEVSVPCRVAVISVTGEFIFIYYGRRNSYTYMGIDIYLGITSGSDEAGGYNGCEDN